MDKTEATPQEATNAEEPYAVFTKRVGQGSHNESLLYAYTIVDTQEVRSVFITEYVITNSLTFYYLQFCFSNCL